MPPSVQRVAVATSYIDELNQRLVDHLTLAGIEVTAIEGTDKNPVLVILHGEQEVMVPLVEEMIVDLDPSARSANTCCSARTLRRYSGTTFSARISAVRSVSTVTPDGAAGAAVEVHATVTAPAFSAVKRLAVSLNSRAAGKTQSPTRAGWASPVTTPTDSPPHWPGSAATSFAPHRSAVAVVIAAVAGLVKPRLLPKLWGINRVEAATAFITFGVTILTAPRIYWGVLTGVLMGLAHFLYLRLHPRIIEVGLHPDGSLRDRHLWHLPPLAPGLFALRMDAALDFASASALERHISEHLARHHDADLPLQRLDLAEVRNHLQIRR